MSIRWQIFAAPDYLRSRGTPSRVEELDDHALILFGDYRPPVTDINFLAEAGRRTGSPRRALLEVNSLPCHGGGDQGRRPASALCPTGCRTSSAG